MFALAFEAGPAQRVKAARCRQRGAEPIGNPGRHAVCTGLTLTVATEPGFSARRSNLLALTGSGHFQHDGMLDAGPLTHAGKRDAEIDA